MAKLGELHVEGSWEAAIERKLVGLTCSQQGAHFSISFASHKAELWTNMWCQALKENPRK